MTATTVNATLSQNGDSVTLPLLAESGSPLVTVDYGKPHLTIHDRGGALFPRTRDTFSGLEQFNVIGRFTGSSAFTKARDLIDLIQSDGNGDTMTLDFSALNELDDNMTVAPSAGADRAVNVSYPPGHTNTVEFDIGFTRVSDTLGSYNRTISTPTASGTGPVTISNGTNTVELDYDLQVDRYAGRPNDVVRKTPSQYPRYEVKRKIVNDEFEISLLFSDSDAVTDTQDIADIFREQQERGSYTLSFNGVFGLGDFNVMPSGSQALRHTRESGRETTTIIPTINLRRVN